MNKNVIIWCIALATAIIGCKKVDVDFTYSPAAPKAGEVVSFTNNSSAGEKWAWSFGDNSTSVSKNPNKVYKKPGTYIVTLMVDSAKYNTYSRSIIIYDTVPTFVVSTDSICHYTDVVLTANVYNPFHHTLTYEWDLPDNCVLTSGTLGSKSIAVYFKQYSKGATDSVQVGISITQNGTRHNISRKLFVYKTKAPSIVMQLTNHTVKRQHLINGYLEDPMDGDGEDVRMIELSSDTVVTFNGKSFYASRMQDIFPTQQIGRLQIDAMAQKWYVITTEGLFVANFDGQNMQCIDATATGGICVDDNRNMLYWATPEGLKAMSLVKSKNNQFSTTPILYNTISDIDRIVVNNKYR